MAYLWGDLYKPVKDFFSKEYNTVPLRLEVTPNPKENDWVAPTVERTNNGDFNITGELGHKFELATGFPSQGKLTVNGNGRVKVEGKTKHSAELVGVELNALADIGPLDNSSDKYEVTLDLRRFQGAGSIVGRFPHNKAAELEASFCSIFKKQWLIGAQGIFSTSFALSSLIVGASHRAPGRVLAATLDKNKSAKVGILLAAANSPTNSEYGAELSVGKATNLSVGMKATVLEGAEKVEYRGKVNNTGALAISFKRRLTSNVTGTFSADIDLRNSKGTYGLKLVWA